MQPTFDYLYTHPTARTDEIVVNTRDLTRDFKKVRTILQRNQTQTIRIHKTPLVIKIEEVPTDIEKFRNFFKDYYQHAPKIKLNKVEYDFPAVKPIKFNKYAS